MITASRHLHHGHGKGKLGFRPNSVGDVHYITNGRLPSFLQRLSLDSFFFCVQLWFVHLQASSNFGIEDVLLGVHSPVLRGCSRQGSHPIVSAGSRLQDVGMQKRIVSKPALQKHTSLFRSPSTTSPTPCHIHQPSSSFLVHTSPGSHHSSFRHFISNPHLVTISTFMCCPVIKFWTSVRMHAPATHFLQPLQC